MRRIKRKDMQDASEGASFNHNRPSVCTRTHTLRPSHDPILESAQTDRATGALKLKTRPLHLFVFPTPSRLTLEGLVPFDHGEREIDLVRARLPQGMRQVDMQVRHAF